MEIIRTSFICLGLLLSGSVAGASAIDTLLFEPEARGRFVQKWAPAIHALRFERPAGPEADPAFRVHHESHGVSVVDADGKRAVLAPVRDLHGVSRVQIVFSDGATTHARPSDSARTSLGDATLTQLVPEEPKTWNERLVLQWAPEESVQQGRRGWLLEKSVTSTWDGNVTRTVLVDVSLGKRLSDAQEAYHLVAVVRAEGLPILDELGRVLCIVVRPASKKEGHSMCARREVFIPKKETTP